MPSKKKPSSTVHKVNRKTGPKVIGSAKPPKMLQRLQKAAKKKPVKK